MTKTFIKSLAVLAGAAIASGCASVAAENPSEDASSRSISTSDYQASQRRINELESTLAARERDLASAESRAATAAAAGTTMKGDTSLFPPNPKAGECYARVLIPATYETVSEQVLKSDKGERIEVVQARYETVQETVLVKEASTTLEVIPAVYGKVQERVMVKPASKKIVEVPAVYETVKENVLDKPAHTAWKKGAPASQSSSVLSQSTTDTGEIMCLVEVPATYKTVEKRVLVTPARTDEIAIPAEYKTVAKTIVKQPATTREVLIPAKYQTVEVTKLVSPANERRVAVPAEYQTVTRTKKASDEGMEWRQVMCETNMTRANVIALQKSLADAGYYKASVDGVMGGQTLAAARKYALDKNLPAGSNYVPMEVVKSLKISL